MFDDRRAVRKVKTSAASFRSIWPFRVPLCHRLYRPLRFFGTCVLNVLMVTRKGFVVRIWAGLFLDPLTLFLDPKPFFWTLTLFLDPQPSFWTLGSEKRVSPSFWTLHEIPFPFFPGPLQFFRWTLKLFFWTRPLSFWTLPFFSNPFFGPSNLFFGPLNSCFGP